MLTGRFLLGSCLALGFSTCGLFASRLLLGCRLLCRCLAFCFQARGFGLRRLLPGGFLLGSCAAFGFGASSLLLRCCLLCRGLLCRGLAFGLQTLCRLLRPGLLCRRFTFRLQPSRGFCTRCLLSSRFQLCRGLLRSGLAFGFETLGLLALGRCLALRFLRGCRLLRQGLLRKGLALGVGLSCLLCSRLALGVQLPLRLHLGRFAPRRALAFDFEARRFRDGRFLARSLLQGRLAFGLNTRGLDLRQGLPLDRLACGLLPLHGQALGFNPRRRLPVGILLRCGLPRGFPCFGFPCFGFLFRGLQAFRCLLLNLLCGALAQGHLGGGRGC